MDNNYLLYFVQTKKSYPLAKGKALIAGKSRDESSLHLVSYFEGEINTISRKHFRLYNNPNGLFIEDLGSRNGTEVNDKLLPAKKRKQLFHSDIIRIAKNDNFKIEVIDESSGTDVINTQTIADERPIIPSHGLYFDESEKIFYIDGKPLDGLEPRAMEVLEYLYQHKRKECSLYNIRNDVFGRYVKKDSVRAAVSSIRAKFDEISPGSKKRYLKTVHGSGYKLVTE